MAGVVIPFPRFRQRPLPFPRTPRLVTRPAEQMLPRAVTSLVFITAVLTFYIFQVSVIATSSYDLQSLERERDGWRSRNEQLQLELAKARSLEWVGFEATQRLGMVRGENVLYVSLPPSPSAISAPAPLPNSFPAVSDSVDEETDEAAVANEDAAGTGSAGSTRTFLGWFAALFER